MATLSTRRRFFSLCSLVLAILAGCSSESGDGFKGERGQVSGTVTLDGTPLKQGCQVLFIAKVGGYTGAGVVEDGGKYSLRYKYGAGVPVGEYLVQLSAPFEPEPMTEKVDPVQMASKLHLTNKNKPTAESPFPVEYASTSTSGLMFKVQPNQNTIDIKLEKKEAKK